MHFFVLALISCGKRGFCGDSCKVSVFVGIIFYHQTNLVWIGFEELFDDRTGRYTVRSLEIDELDDGDRCLSRPNGGRIANGDFGQFFLGICRPEQQEDKNTTQYFVYHGQQKKGIRRYPPFSSS